jgi:hypothetical protein
VLVGDAPNLPDLNGTWRTARIELSINGRQVAGILPGMPKLTMALRTN